MNQPAPHMKNNPAKNPSSYQKKKRYHVLTHKNLPNCLASQRACHWLALPTHYYVRSSALAELYTIDHFPREGQRTLAFVTDRVLKLLAAIVCVPYATVFSVYPDIRDCLSEPIGVCQLVINPLHIHYLFGLCPRNGANARDTGVSKTDSQKPTSHY